MEATMSELKIKLKTHIDQSHLFDSEGKEQTVPDANTSVQLARFWGEADVMEGKLKGRSGTVYSHLTFAGPLVNSFKGVAPQTILADGRQLDKAPPTGVSFATLLSTVTLVAKDAKGKEAGTIQMVLSTTHNQKSDGSLTWQGQKRYNQGWQVLNGTGDFAGIEHKLSGGNILQETMTGPKFAAVLGGDSYICEITTKKKSFIGEKTQDVTPAAGGTN
jgi:hypothetical protein